MKDIHEAIDRYAFAAEQRQQQHKSQPADEKDYRDVVIYPYLSVMLPGQPPRLNHQEIQLLSEAIPFELPVELYELYKRGNGCLPIGTGQKDWNRYENYCAFPNAEAPMMSLADSIKCLREDMVQRSLIPVAYPEDRGAYLIQCDTQQTETAPVILSYEEPGDEIVSPKWPSLTNMLMAHTEFIERNIRLPVCEGQEAEFKMICQKYGREDKWSIRTSW